MRDKFLATVKGIKARLADYAEPGYTFVMHVCDKHYPRRTLAAHYLYGPEGSDWLEKDCGKPDELMVIVTLPPRTAMSMYRHRSLDVWVSYGNGKMEELTLKQHHSGFVYDMNNRAIVARHIGTYLKTATVPSTLSEISKPVLQ